MIEYIERYNTKIWSPIYAKTQSNS